MEDRRYDVIVIGAGPAGCRAAAVLAENGKQTALADCVSPGGTCLRTGCIPTKKLSLAAAGLRRRLREEPAGSFLSAQCSDPKNMKNNGSPANRENRHLKDDIRQTAWEDFLQETAQTAKEMTEGIRLVRETSLHLLRNGDVLGIPGFYVNSACRLLGYRLGKAWKRLPKWLALRLSMNPEFIRSHLPDT